MQQNRSQSLSQRERIYQFLYLVLMLVLTQIALGLLFLSSYHSPFSQIALLDAQLLEQQKQFNEQQKAVEPFVIEAFQKISQLQAVSPQPQLENEIVRGIHGVSNFFGSTTCCDPRKEGYRQLGDFYEMYFEDKKIAARKTENIQQFRKDFEECTIGFKDKEQQLIQRKNIQLAR